MNQSEKEINEVNNLINKFKVKFDSSTNFEEKLNIIYEQNQIIIKMISNLNLSNMERQSILEQKLNHIIIKK